MIGDTVWPEVAMGDVCEEITVGFVGPMTAEYRDAGVPFLRSMNIEPFRINKTDLKFVSPEFHARISKSRLRAGDVVIVRTGAPGTAAVVPDWMHNGNCSDLVIARPGPGVEAQFLCYYVNAVTHHIVNEHVVGAVQQHFNVGAAKSLKLPLPPLPEQRSIARVLRGLDDKIELNRRMNRTLEDLARGLFRSWFVDFDPVTKPSRGFAGPSKGLAGSGSPGPSSGGGSVPLASPSAGAASPSAGAAPADLFPKRLVDSPLGPIPEGWRVSTIGQEVTVVGGSTPSTDEPKFWEGGKHCWVTPRDLSRLSEPVVIDCERRITDAGLTQISSGLMPKGTVLMSSRAPIGYLAIADVPVAVNQGFIALKCDKGLPGVFVLRWCEENIEEVLSRAGGTTFAEISKAAFRPIPMVVPPADVVQAFARAAQGWHDQIVANVRQTRQLAALRDALLPQLLSGEIRLREAERAVGDVLRSTSPSPRAGGNGSPRAGMAAGTSKGRA